MAHTPLNKKLWAFVDIETLGLDPLKYEMIEIAILRSDGITYCTKIKPEFPEKADPKAVACNGFNLEEWENAPSLKEEAETIFRILKDCILVGQNVNFDLSFLEVAAAQQNIKTSWGHHHIDTVTLAWEHLVPLGLKYLTLKNICLFLGIPPEPDQHRALAGATACKKIYETLLRASWLDRMIWLIRNMKIEKP